VVSVCCSIGGPDTTEMPQWLDVASSYWAPIPALAGAYLVQWRAMRPVAVAGV
jgi:hypothetical protein